MENLNNQSQQEMDFTSPGFDEMTIDDLRVMYAALMGIPPRIGENEAAVIVNVLEQSLRDGCDKAKEAEMDRLRIIDTEEDKGELVQMYRVK